MLVSSTGLFFTVSVGQLGIVMWNPARKVSEAEFDDYVNAYSQMVERGNKAPFGLINFAYNFVPSAHMRAAMKAREAELGLVKLRGVCVISGSALVRGAITALSWAIPGPKTHAYAPGQHGEALRWLAKFAEFDLAQAHEQIGKGSAVVGAELGDNGAKPPRNVG